MENPVAMNTVFDPHFINEVVRDANGVASSTLLRTSRTIVLFQNETVDLGMAVPVPESADLTVYGDIVRVHGSIRLPGRKVKIVCRQLEFHPRAGICGFDVSGAKGGDADSKATSVAAEKGNDGSDSSREGKIGTAGLEDTPDGGMGGAGGEIAIHCGSFIRLGPVTLLARGGNGGRGADGQNGGAGGSGYSGFKGNEGNFWPESTDGCIPSSRPCQFSSAARGGEGGCGGNGGRGGNGGGGGKITIDFFRIDLDPGGNRKVKWSVRGGDGGDGGKGGKGGRGGDGGKPNPNMRHIGPASMHYLDGGDAGGGGIHGWPGDGGTAGPSGGVSFALPGDWFTLPDTVVLPPGPSEPKKVLPGRDDDLPADRRARAIVEAQRRSDQAAWAVYIQNRKKWATECQAIQAHHTHFPEPQVAGKPGDFPQNLFECSPRGTPGSPSEPLQVDQNRPDSWNYRRGHPGAIRASNTTRRAKKTYPTPPPVTVTKQETHAVTAKHIAAEADLEQCEMLLDHLRVRYLLADVQNEQYDRGPFNAVLDWLFLIADSRSPSPLLETSAAANSGAVTPPLMGDSWPQVRAITVATREKLRQRLNIFGYDAEFVALGTDAFYRDKVGEMVKHYSEVEKTYRQLSASLISAQERSSYLSNVASRQSLQIDALDSAQKEVKAKLTQTLAAIEQLEESKRTAIDEFNNAVGRFHLKILESVGISPADIFSALSQLSFTNREISSPNAAAVPAPQGHPRRDAAAAASVAEMALSPGGVLASGAMLVSQVGDLMVKAANNVVTDSGESVNKNFVIQRIQNLDREVKSFDDLKKTSDGLIQTGSESRLLATREQLEGICGNFYQRYPDAKKVMNHLNTYMEAVVARNKKVEEYNQQLSGLIMIAAELMRSRAQKDAAETAFLKAADPGKPAMVRYVRVLRRNAWENCVRQLYMTCKTFTLRYLDSMDVFSGVLGKLAGDEDVAELNITALSAALIELDSAKLDKTVQFKTSRQIFEPEGAHFAILLVRPKAKDVGETAPAAGNESIIKLENLTFFNNLRAGKAARIRLLGARRVSSMKDGNPFAGASDVRLTHVRCQVAGVVTGDGICKLELTHPGSETFVDENDREVHLHHSETKVTLTCRVGTPKDPKPPVGKPNDDWVALDEDHLLIGPFCEWTVAMPENSNLHLNPASIESLRLDFRGTCRSFS